MIKKHTAAIAAFISLASFTTINASAADNSTALSHSSGYYDNSQLVTVVNYDDETDIYFTTDGSKPGTDSALYDGTPISVSENTVVRIAAYSGEDLINTAKASIKIRTASPSASAESGEYSDAVKVKLTCSDPDAVIYYTTDGSTPTKDSAKYKKAITISDSTTLKFATIAPDKSRSKVVTEKYVIKQTDFDDPMCQALFELVNENPRRVRTVAAQGSHSTDGSRSGSRKGVLVLSVALPPRWKQMGHYPFRLRAENEYTRRKPRILLHLRKTGDEMLDERPLSPRKYSESRYRVHRSGVLQ